MLTAMIFFFFGSKIRQLQSFLFWKSFQIVISIVAKILSVAAAFSPWPIKSALLRIHDLILSAEQEEILINNKHEQEQALTQQKKKSETLKDAEIERLKMEIELLKKKNFDLKTKLLDQQRVAEEDTRLKTVFMMAVVMCGVSLMASHAPVEQLRWVMNFGSDPSASVEKKVGFAFSVICAIFVFFLLLNEGSILGDVIHITRILTMAMCVGLVVLFQNPEFIEWLFWTCKTFFVPLIVMGWIISAASFSSGNEAQVEDTSAPATPADEEATEE